MLPLLQIIFMDYTLHLMQMVAVTLQMDYPIRVVATEYTFTLPEEVPIRKGYTFLGWSELKTASTPTYTTGSLFTTDTSTTLYAIWSVNEYAIHFNTNGSSDTIPSIVADYGDTIEIPDIVPTRPGFDFSGWAYEQDGEPVYNIGDSFVLDNYDITFYAVWVISKNKLSSPLIQMGVI